MEGNSAGGEHHELGPAYRLRGELMPAIMVQQNCSEADARLGPDPRPLLATGRGKSIDASFTVRRMGLKNGQAGSRLLPLPYLRTGPPKGRHAARIAHAMFR